MVASRQVEVPFHWANGRQREMWFGSIAQITGRTAVQFLHEYVVPFAKLLGADLLEIAAQKLHRLLAVGKTSRQLQRVWEGKVWENN